MKKILYISLLDWYFTKQRPQHFAELLSKENNIKYVCRASWNSHQIKKHDESENICSNFKISETLRIKRLRYLPLNKIRPISILNTFLYKVTIKIIIIRFRPEILWLTHPEQYSLIPRNYTGKIIYDCMDNYSQFLKDSDKKKEIDELERKLVNRVDFIISSSNGLHNKISRITNTKKVVTIKNASDFSHFNNYFNLCQVKKKPIDLMDNKKIIGYFGGISSWFDVDLLIFVANKHKNCEFVIIGPISNEKIITQTSKSDNIKFIGPKVYKELASYLYYFDVCIMPFLVNDLIRDVNPVKLYEYLSMGKPVIVPEYDEIKEFADYIYLAQDYEDFSRKLGIALNENNECLIRQRINFARENTWETRVNQINRLINHLEKDCI